MRGAYLYTYSFDSGSSPMAVLIKYGGIKCHSEPKKLMPYSWNFGSMQGHFCQHKSTANTNPRTHRVNDLAWRSCLLAWTDRDVNTKQTKVKKGCDFCSVELCLFSLYFIIIVITLVFKIYNNKFIFYNKLVKIYNVYCYILLTSIVFWVDSLERDNGL